MDVFKNTKKIIFFKIAYFIVFLLWILTFFVVVITSFDEEVKALKVLPVSLSLDGEGTRCNPYLISQVGDFGYLKNNPGYYYKLLNDIDLSEYKISTIDEFTGELDGNNMCIILPKMTNSLINTLTGTIKNITINININLEISTNIIDNYNFGALANEMSLNSCLSNVKMTGTLSFSAIFSSWQGGATSIIKIGGFVGNVKDNYVFSYCINNIEINASVTNNSRVIIGKQNNFYIYVGGIVGYADGSGKLSQCGNTNQVKGLIYKSNNSYSYVGGVAGHYSGKNTIQECYNTGNITSGDNASFSSYAGGIVAYADTKLIQYCYNSGNISALAKTQTSTSYIKRSNRTTVEQRIDNNYMGNPDEEKWWYSNLFYSFVLGPVFLGQGLSEPFTLTEYEYDYYTIYRYPNITKKEYETKAYAGGIVGFSNDSLNINDCFNKGNVKGGTKYTQCYNKVLFCVKWSTYAATPDYYKKEYYGGVKLNRLGDNFYVTKTFYFNQIDKKYLGNINGNVLATNNRCANSGSLQPDSKISVGIQPNNTFQVNGVVTNTTFSIIEFEGNYILKPSSTYSDIVDKTNGIEVSSQLVTIDGKSYASGEKKEYKKYFRFY